jgi:threonine aldolase
MDFTQICLAIVGSISIWALKSVIELQKVTTKQEGDIAQLRETANNERKFLEYKLDALQKSFDAMAIKLDRIINAAGHKSGGYPTRDFEN